MPRGYYLPLFAIASTILTMPLRAAAAPTFLERIPAVGAKACVVIANLPEFDAKLRRSQIGKIYADESMQVFAAEFRKNGDAKWLQRIGLSYNELKDVARGELCWAMLEAPEKQAAYLVLLDVTGNEAAAQRQIAKAGDRLVQRSAKRRMRQIADTQVVEYELALRGRASKKTAFALRGNTLLIATDTSPLEPLLRDWDHPAAESLAGDECYRAVQASCGRQVGGNEADMTWFFDPLGVVTLLSKPDPLDLEKTDGVARFKRLGLDGAKGIGGYVSIARGSYDVVAGLVVHAPPPRDKTLAVLSFPEGKNFSPLDWLPNDLTMHSVLYWNLVEALDHIGPLFDDAAADGIEGTFDDILADLKSDVGPGVDLREDLFKLLGPRVTLVNGSAGRGAAGGESTLVAIEASDEPAVALAVKKLVRDDPGVRRLRVPGQENDLWIIGGESGIGPKEESKRRFRSVALMASRGHLLLATDAELIKHVLGGPTDANLAQAKDLARVHGELAKLSTNGVGLRLFSRLNRDLEATYEHVRLGTSDRITSVYGTFVRKFLDAMRDEQTGRLPLDFGTLPKFAAVQRHFGWAAVVGKTEEQGWALVGILLSPKATDE